MKKIIYMFENKLFILKKVSDIFVYLLDITTNTIRKMFATEIEKMKRIVFISKEM